MDRGPWQAIVHGIPKSQTWLSKEHQVNSTHSSYIVYFFYSLWNNIQYMIRTLSHMVVLRGYTQINKTWNATQERMLLLLLSCFSCVQLCATPQTAAHQAPPSLGFSRQEHWSGLPFPSLMHESEVTQSCPTLRESWTAAYQAPPSMGFSRQEYWSGVPLPSPRKEWDWWIKISSYVFFKYNVIYSFLISYMLELQTVFP